MDVVVHLGTGKAGSSTLQAFCRQNRARLGELGLLYPRSPGRERHNLLSMSVKSDAELAITPAWSRQDESDPSVFRREVRHRLRKEIARAGLPRVLLSDEELFGLSDQALRRLGRFTGRIADRVTLVVYLRRQDDHLVSRYQQGVKIGWVARLSEWAREDMSPLYRYDRRLELHERLVAPAEVVVRRFEPGSFVGGSLFQDFLDAVGVPVPASDLTLVPPRNPSLDAESVEFLRLLNLHRVESEGAHPGLIDNREIVTRLAPASTGATLTLPEPVLDEFMGLWEESNRAVARRFLHDREGRLFREPRKTTGTTTRQRVDPERLDHFLGLAELPERLRAPLRRLVEREGRTA